MYSKFVKLVLILLFISCDMLINTLKLERIDGG